MEIKLDHRTMENCRDFSSLVTRWFDIYQQDEYWAADIIDMQDGEEVSLLYVQGPTKAEVICQLEYYIRAQIAERKSEIARRRQALKLIEEAKQ
jgi:hypothetical protein